MYDDLIQSHQSAADAVHEALRSTTAALVAAEGDLAASRDECARLVAELETLRPRGPRIGIYVSGDPGDDSEAFKHFGAYPEIANDYYQVGGPSARGNPNTGSYMKLVEHQTPRVQRGTACLLALSLKGYYGNGTDNSNIGLKVLATPSHPDHADMLTILDNYIARLHELSLVDPDVPIYAGLEGEVDAKVNKFETGATGDKINATRAEAGIALNLFLTRLKAGAPNVKGCLWFAQTRKPIINAVLSHQTPGMVDCIIGDPYTNGNGVETMLHCWKSKWLDWIRANEHFIRLNEPDLGIGECGMAVGANVNPPAPDHTDAEYAVYIKPSATYTMRDTMRDAGVAFASLFDSTRDLDHEITDGEHPLSVAAFADSLRRK